MSVVYLTAHAEDRCKKEIDHAFMIGEVYGDWKAAARIREKAYQRFAPYKRVWLQAPAKREKPE